MNKLTAILVVLMTILFVGCVQQNETIQTNESESLSKKLAYLEMRVLLDECVALTWNSEPEPQDPGEAIVYINKCIHQYSYFSETKKLLEESQFYYWPEKFQTSGDIEDLSKFDFKKPSYPVLWN